MAFRFFVGIFHGVLELHVIRIDVINSCQFSSVVELRLFSSPHAVFLFVESCSTYLTTTLAIINRAWRLHELLSILSPDHDSSQQPSTFQ